MSDASDRGEPSVSDEPRDRPEPAALPDGGAEPDPEDSSADPTTDATDASDSEASGDTDSDHPAETDADATSDHPAETDADATDDPDSDATDASDSEADAEALEARTDGEGYVGDRPEREEPAYPDPEDDVGGISTPPDDEEMPLADHIEEMVLRLAKVVLVGAAGTAIGLLWASQAIEFIWFSVFPESLDPEPPPYVYHPLELWLTRIKVAALLGILVALPMFVYQCYRFMRPGLYPHERKYYLAAVPSSLVLASVGMAFSFVLVLPVLFMYFTFYSDESALIAYGLGETFDLIITLMTVLAVAFQIPLFIMLAIMMGVTTRRWLEQKRLYFWAAFAGLAFMFTMDPTMMAPILVAITMIILFEGTLALLRWTGR